MFPNRFPVSIQHDSRQCGVACLKIICEYFGKKYSFYDISQYCHASKKGVSLLGISEGATSLGLDYLSFKCSVSSLKNNLKYPAIIHWKQNHFVVLYKISKNGKYFYVSDPGKGLVKLSREEFEDALGIYWGECAIRYDSLRHWVVEENWLVHGKYELYLEDRFGNKISYKYFDNLFKSPDNKTHKRMFREFKKMVMD